MRLVCRDLQPGSLLRAAGAEDRTSTTWQALVDERLKALGTPVLSLVSDRAKALMQLAAQGVECLRMPAFFHGVPAIVQRSSLPRGRRVRHAHQERKEAKEALARLQGRPHAAHDGPEAEALVDARPAEATRWEEGPHPSRRLCETLSCTRQPCSSPDATPQPSAPVARPLHMAVEAIAVCAPRSP
jgi:hypothetical protein